jgi:hypothetical protein
LLGGLTVMDLVSGRIAVPHTSAARIAQEQ